MTGSLFQHHDCYQLNFCVQFSERAVYGACRCRPSGAWYKVAFPTVATVGYSLPPLRGCEDVGRIYIEK